MNFAEWEPIYEEILSDFGFDRAADERARDLLATMTEPFDLDRLDFRGQAVAVAGAGPSLIDDVTCAQSADVVVAASTAADTLLGAGVEVDLQVTDLDGNEETTQTLTHTGVPVAVHAHGDNIPALREHVPRLDREQVVPTTQARPVGSVINLGGFTDGDRAAFFADHLGAETLCFPGWTFDDPTVTEIKRQKLMWAERLLRWLERRRGERFEILDGRRDGIDETAFQ